MGPAARMKLGVRVALRRRYGYAALRVLRRYVAWALEDNLRRSIGEARFVSQIDQIALIYWRGLQKLRRRWPKLDLEDPRGDA